MLSYELAKQLMDVGFKQNDHNNCYVDGQYMTGYECFLEEEYLYAKELIYIPTLEELIEACGEIILNIKHTRNSTKGWWWVAETLGIGWEIKCEGQTPSEAVAKLYLELNKK